MKKVSLFMIFILFLSLVIAAPNNPGNSIGNQVSVGNNSGDDRGNSGESENNQSLGLGQVIRNRVKKGVYNSESGKKIRVSEMARNRIKLKVGNVSVECPGNLTMERVQNESRFKMKLSNGRNARIKVMPDVASEKALERLRLRNCNPENNCTIELKEVGKKNKLAAYEINLEKESKILGIFKKKMRVQSQVSAEDGSVIRIRKPWWAFLASEREE